MKLIDITVPISNHLPVWPGDPSITLSQKKSIASGDVCNLTTLRMGVHTGTHIDAPYHFRQDGTTTDMIPIETFIGRCLVVEIDAAPLISKVHLPMNEIKGHSRVLFKTKNSDLWNRKTSVFDPNFVSLGIDAAQKLVDLKISLVGIDYLSIESFHSSNNQIHALLLEHNIVILEGINLAGVKPGVYEILCLPLSLLGCEGAPARVVLRDATGDQNRC